MIGWDWLGQFDNEEEKEDMMVIMVKMVMIFEKMVDDH